MLKKPPWIVVPPIWKPPVEEREMGLSRHWEVEVEAVVKAIVEKRREKETRALRLNREIAS